MVFVCPNVQCGRKFEQEGAMIEHVRRRHPDQMSKLDNILSKTIMFNDKKKQEQIAKLPRLKLRPSQSKDKPKDILPKLPNAVKFIKPSDIISNSRFEVKAMDASDRNKPKILKTEQQRVNSRGSQKEESLSQQMTATSQMMTPKNDFRRTLLRRKSSKDILDKTASDDQGTHEERLGTATTANDFSGTKVTSKDVQSTVASKLATVVSSKTLLKNEVATNGRPIIRISKSKEKTKIFTPAATTPSNLYLRRPSSKSKFSQATSESSNLQPAKKQQPKVTEQQPFDLRTLEESSTIIIKKPMRYFSPPFFCIEYLSLNGCGLTDICLEGLELLIELSASHNKLNSMQFLLYGSNENLQKVHLENNSIHELLIPKNIKVITIAFNRLDNLDKISSEISRNSSLEQIDLSFNPVKKLYNYKYELLLRGKNLRKVDGLKITKYDIDLALEYKAMSKRQKPVEVQKGTARYYDRFHKRIQQDYSFAFAQKLTQEQYEKMRKEHQEYLRKTNELQNDLDVIQTENGILQEQLEATQLQQTDSANINIELMTLQAEMETLEMLNMLQYADEQELMQLIEAVQARL